MLERLEGYTFFISFFTALTSTAVAKPESTNKSLLFHQSLLYQETLIWVGFFRYIQLQIR